MKAQTTIAGYKRKHEEQILRGFSINPSTWCRLPKVCCLSVLVFWNKSLSSKQGLDAESDTIEPGLLLFKPEQNQTYKALGTVSALPKNWYSCQQAGRECLWIYFPAVKPPLHFTGSRSSPRFLSLDVNGRKQAGLLASQRWKQRGLEQKEETAQSAADMKAMWVQTDPKPGSHDCRHETFTAILVSQSNSRLTVLYSAEVTVRGLLDTFWHQRPGFTSCLPPVLRLLKHYVRMVVL